MNETKNLLDKALTNYDAAKILRNSIKDENEEIINLIGYHLQQSIELSIKYSLEMNGIEYPSTHRIEDLIKIANKNKVDVYINEYIKEHDALLTSWEFNTRYIIGYLIELEKIDKAIPEIESYLKKLIAIYSK